MECWGVNIINNSNGYATVTLPVSFSSTSYFVICSPVVYVANNLYITFECSAQIAAVNKINLYARQHDGGILSGVQCNWFAVGKWK